MGADQTEQAQIATTGIDHVGLTVLDLEVARRFFCECRGWKVVGGSPSYPAAFVSDGHDPITLWQVQGPVYTKFDRKKNLGLHHLALKVSDIESLNTTKSLAVARRRSGVCARTRQKGTQGPLHGSGFVSSSLANPRRARASREQLNTRMRRRT